MKEKYKPLLVALVTFTLMLNVLTFLAARPRREREATPTRAEATGCRVELLSPKPGETVGPTGVVKGTASIPDGSYLWVLERRREGSLWRPQGRAPARIREGRWVVRVEYGDERDRGREFYFAAVVVDVGVNQQIEGWVEGQRMRFPETVPGCKIQMVAVRRGK